MSCQQAYSELGRHLSRLNLTSKGQGRLGACAAQVYCLSWNVVRRNVFLSGSWDDTIKLWDLARPASLATFKEHTYCVYAANWCAHALPLLQRVGPRALPAEPVICRPV